MFYIHPSDTISPSEPSPSLCAPSMPPMLEPLNCPLTEDPWAEADQHMASTVVPAVLSAYPIEDKNHALCSGIYTYFSSQYGTRSSQSRCRTRKHKGSGVSLAKLREMRNSLRRAKKSGQSSDVIRSLAGQFHLLLRQYNKTSRLEQRLSGEEAVRSERKQCASAFAKKILEEVSSPSTSGSAFDAQTAQEFFTDIYSSDNADFQHPNWLPHPAPPSHPFEEGPITSEELDRVLGKVRQRASPSPLDQVSYSVLCRCPSLQPALLHIFNVCWAQQLVLRSWKEGVICVIPKTAAEEAPDLPSNFRPIALTSCV